MLLVFLVLFACLLPFLVPLQAVLSLLWFPAVTVRQPRHDATAPDTMTCNTSLDGYATGDEPKFYGMGYAVLQTPGAWNKVLSCWDRANKAFMRPTERDRAFSGDMMAGMLLALSVRMKKHGFTDQEKSFLSALVWKLAFGLFPFRFAHKDKSRGYFWTPLCLNLEGLFMVLALLKIGIHCEKNRAKRIVLRVLYGIFLVLHLPLIPFGMYDHNIYIGRIYACWWYGSHSDALVYASAARLDIPFARRGLKKLYARYGKQNADIAALAYTFGCTPASAFEDVCALVQDAHAARDLEGLSCTVKDYFSLRDFPAKGFKAWKPRATEFLGGQTCQDYIWERNPQEQGWPRKNRGDLDLFFPMDVALGRLTAV